MSTRSGPWTRSPNLRTLPQMYPSVSGFTFVPSIARIRPSSTVTASEQRSGQSRGHTDGTIGMHRGLTSSWRRPSGARRTTSIRPNALAANIALHAGVEARERRSAQPAERLGHPVREALGREQHGPTPVRAAANVGPATTPRGRPTPRPRAPGRRTRSTPGRPSPTGSGTSATRLPERTPADRAVPIDPPAPLPSDAPCMTIIAPWPRGRSGTRSAASRACAARRTASRCTPRAACAARDQDPARGGTVRARRRSGEVLRGLRRHERRLPGPASNHPTHPSRSTAADAVAAARTGPPPPAAGLHRTGSSPRAAQPAEHPPANVTTATHSVPRAEAPPAEPPRDNLPEPRRPRRARG